MVECTIVQIQYGIFKILSMSTARTMNNNNFTTLNYASYIVQNMFATKEKYEKKTEIVQWNNQSCSATVSGGGPL